MTRSSVTLHILYVSEILSAAEWKALGAEVNSGQPVGKVCADGAPITLSSDQVKTLSDAGVLDKAPGEDFDRVIAWTISTEHRDRDHDRIKVAGWELAHYRKNAVVMWGHNYKEPPIGRSIKTWKDHSGDYARLRMLKQFAPKDMNPFAHMVYRLTQGGYLNTASVGFKALEAEPDPDLSEDELAKFPRALLFTKQQLLESSVVPIPSNPQALNEAKSVAGIDVSPLATWVERRLDGEVSDPVVGSRVLWETYKQIRPETIIVAPPVVKDEETTEEAPVEVEVPQENEPAVAVAPEAATETSPDTVEISIEEAREALAQLFN